MTNSEQTLLQQLHDIHLPAPLSLWPFAPGWYVVFIFAVLVVLGSIGWTWRWYKRGKVKREALRLLGEYEKTHTNPIVTIAAINELLKRVALVYFPREQVAGLYGKDWLLFLAQTSKKLKFVEEGNELIWGPYQPPADKPRDVGVGTNSLPHLFYLARQWVSQRGKPCLS